MALSEELAYGYLRLSGFFPLTNFVSHTSDSAEYSGDCDVLAYKPSRRERSMRSAALLIIAAATALLAPKASGQQIRLVGQITEVTVFGNGGRLAALCPGCTRGGTVTLDVELAAPQCSTSAAGRCESARFRLGGASANRVTVSVGDMAWRADAGDAAIRADHILGRTEFRITGSAAAVMPGTPSRLGIDFGLGAWLRGIVFANGRLSAPDQTFQVPEHSYDWGRDLFQGSLSVLGCGRGAAGGTPSVSPGTGATASGCTESVGAVGFVIHSMSTRAADAAPSARPALVIFVGGFHDDEADQQYVVRLERAWTPPAGTDVTKRYHLWSSEGEIRAEVRRFLAANPGGTVVLVGHSWGGHTAWKVAEYLEDPLRINLLITLDPVPHGSAGDPSARRGRQPRPRGQPAPAKPNTVDVWLNVWPGPRNISTDCDLVAAIGENFAPWGDIPGLTPLRAGRHHCDTEGMFDVVKKALADLLTGRQ